MLSFIISFLLLSIPDQQDIPLRLKHYNINSSLALQGYDPVSYFSGKPEQGKKTFVYQYKGIAYYFSSINNLEKFKKSPDSYEPMYGGWCAYAMGNDGTKVEIDPETYKIIDGRLYLFYNFYFTNTLKKWNENESSLHTKANTNWRKIISK